MVTSTFALLATVLMLGSSAGPDIGPRLDPQHLPTLPRAGVAEQVGERTVLLRTLGGRSLGHLDGYAVSFPQPAHRLEVEHGPTHWTLDTIARRLRPAPRARDRGSLCRTVDTRAVVHLRVCGASEHLLVLEDKGRRKTLVAAPVHPPRGTPVVGHWVTAELSPDGRTVLGLWTAECETPLTFLISRPSGHARPVSRDRYGPAVSIALGWTRSGEAVVYLPAGGCSGNSGGTAGVYYVNPVARLRRAFPTGGQMGTFAMWGG